MTERRSEPRSVGPCTQLIAALAFTGAAQCGQIAAARDPSRIVSIGGAVAENRYALGIEQRIVAVDSPSFHPPRARLDKLSIGYFRQLSPGGVLGLNLSLVGARAAACRRTTLS